MLLTLITIRLFVFIPGAQNDFPFFLVVVLSQLDSWPVTHRWRCIGKCSCQAAAVWSWTAGKGEQLKKSRSLHTGSRWQQKYPSRYSNPARCRSWLYLGQFLPSSMATGGKVNIWCNNRCHLGTGRSARVQTPVHISASGLMKGEKQGRPQPRLKDQVLPLQLVFNSVDWICRWVWSQDHREEGLVCFTAL